MRVIVYKAVGCTIALLLLVLAVLANLYSVALPSSVGPATAEDFARMRAAMQLPGPTNAWIRQPHATAKPCQAGGSAANSER